MKKQLKKQKLLEGGDQRRLPSDDELLIFLFENVCKLAEKIDKETKTQDTTRRYGGGCKRFIAFFSSTFFSSSPCTVFHRGRQQRRSQYFCFEPSLRFSFIHCSLFFFGGFGDFLVLLLFNTPFFFNRSLFQHLFNIAISLFAEDLKLDRFLFF